MNILKAFVSLILIGAVGRLSAQEEIVPLRYNAQLQDLYKASQSATANSRSNLRVGNFVYRIDTMEVPFIDDFTKNNIKQYKAKQSDPNISPEIRTLFSANGLTPDFLELVFYPTYNYTKLLNGTEDSTLTDEIYIVYYDTSGIEVAFDTAFTNLISTFNETTGLVTYDTLAAETLLVNTFDTLFIVSDNNSKWVTQSHKIGDKAAFINNNYALNPLTQGVATLDGTDAVGFPYDITSETSYGEADLLESKPLNIDSTMSNVFLSFFYQGGGIGNSPDADDSLIVDFYNVRDQEWERVWSTAGATEFDSIFSDQVVLEISANRFLRKGFQFRFRNYATLSGSYDHWHIDYVRLDKNVDTNSIDTIFDISYITGTTSYLGQYTSVPYSHYLAAPTMFQGESNQVSIKNIGPDALFVDGISCSLTDKDNNELLSYSATEDQFQPNSTVALNLLLPTTQIFPDDGEEFATFNTTCLYSATGNNDLYVNDTIRSVQAFRDYYSYDDGTAENAYSLTGAGLSLAYKFETPIKDTLKAFYINLPQMEHDQNPELSFKLMVWTDLNSDPIYEDIAFKTPKYTKGNEFSRYELDEEVEVNGTFYIGFIQSEATKIYVGFDLNNDASDKLAYKVNGEWLPSKKKGALLLRPDFGTEDILAISEVNKPKTELTVYPNPTNSSFQIAGLDEPVNITVFTIDGKMALNRKIDQNDQINCSHLAEGLYFIQAIGINSGNTYSARLVITQ